MYKENVPNVSAVKQNNLRNVSELWKEIEKPPIMRGVSCKVVENNLKKYLWKFLLY